MRLKACLIGGVKVLVFNQYWILVKDTLRQSVLNLFHKNRAKLILNLGVVGRMVG